MEGKSCLESPVFIENNFEVFLHHRGMIAMVNFRRVVMGYRKNHNSITGPTWKYPRLVIWSSPHVSLCFYWIFTGSLNSWTTCLGRTCGTTTSTGPPTSRSALPATSTSHLLVRHFWFLLRLSLFLVSGHFETLSWDLHLLANKTGLPQWDDKRVSDIIFKITIEQNQHFHPFQEIVQYATHQKVSEEYYATVEKEAIRKLYKRWFFFIRKLTKR